MKICVLLVGMVLFFGFALANPVHFTMSGTVSGNTLSGNTSGDLSGNVTFTTNEEFDSTSTTVGLTNGTFTYGDGSNMSGVFSGGIVNNSGNLSKGTMIVNSGDGTYQYTSLLGVFRIVVDTVANTWSGEAWGDMSDFYNKSDIDTMVSALQSNDTAQQQQINDLIYNVTLLSNNVTALWTNASLQEQEIQNNSQNITNLWQNASAQQNQINNNTANITALWNNASAQQNQINNNTANITALWNNASAQQNQINNNTANITALWNNASAQQNQINNNTANITALWNNASLQEAEIQNNTQNITDLWQNASAQETEIQNNADNITNLWNNASAQEAEIQNINNSVSKNAEDIEALRASISSLSDYVHTQIQRLDTRIDTIQDQIQEVEPSYEQTIYPFGAEASSSKQSKFTNIDKLLGKLLDTVYNGATPTFSGVRVQKCVTVPADINIGGRETELCWTEPKFDAELKFDNKSIHIIIGPSDVTPHVSWETGELTIKPDRQVKWFALIKRPYERATAEIHSYIPNSEVSSLGSSANSAKSAYCSTPYLANMMNISCG